MSMIRTEDLTFVRQMVETMRSDPALIAQMEKSDAVSQDEGQVAHGWQHALDVSALGLHVAHEANRLIPGTFNEYQLLVLEASALLHDSGRSVAVKDHDQHGAVITHRYLGELAQRLFGTATLEAGWFKQFRQQCVRNVRCHRSDSWLYKNAEEKRLRNREINDPDMAALLLGDKLCGSEARVDEDKLKLMKRLAKVRVPRGFRRRYKLDAKWTPARIDWNNEPTSEDEVRLLKAVRGLLSEWGINLPGADELEIDAHDRVNGSIKERRIEMFLDKDRSQSQIKGTMVYRLKVDERLATQHLIVTLDWWSDAFHVSAKAAKFLGFRFQIVFNGRSMEYSRTERCWVEVQSVLA